MLRLDQFNNSGFARGASRWKEAAWWVARSLLFAPWFPVPSPVKVAVLRLFGATVGRGVVIRSRVNITFPWRLEIGDHVWIGEEVYILSLDRVTIGSNVCISQRAFLCTGSHDFRSESFDLVTEPIVIGEGCWVAAQAFVGPGVELGRVKRCRLSVVCCLLSVVGCRLSVVGCPRCLMWALCTLQALLSMPGSRGERSATSAINRQPTTDNGPRFMGWRWADFC